MASHAVATVGGIVAAETVIAGGLVGLVVVAGRNPSALNIKLLLLLLLPS